MGQAELLIAGLLVAVAGLSTLARHLSVPYPIVLVVFLPPLLYGSSIYANFGDFRANLRALTLSTVGLVLATMCAVAWAPHSRNAAACPTRSTPTTQAKPPARPAATPASASSKTAALPGATPSARAPARKVSGAGFPFSLSRSATTP